MLCCQRWGTESVAWVHECEAAGSLPAYVILSLLRKLFKQFSPGGLRRNCPTGEEKPHWRGGGMDEVAGAWTSRCDSSSVSSTVCLSRKMINSYTVKTQNLSSLK